MNTKPDPTLRTDFERNILFDMEDPLFELKRAQQNLWCLATSEALGSDERQALVFLHDGLGRHLEKLEALWNKGLARAVT